ncbi:MAG: cobalt ECF transporter T component CbiQ [Anaerolineales bacterium]|nr:MAG: cobalt ECF transporter T component CbiQ [Anaerolineales bacterium]
MHANTFDRYQAGEGLIHSLAPQVKVVLTVLFILSNVLLPDGAWLALSLAWCLVLLTSTLAGLGIGYTLKRSFVALPFALAAVTVAFNLPGQPLVKWNIGPWQLVATDAGVIRFASIVVRTWLSVQMAILLTATTRFPDLIHALNHLHIPQLLVAIISFMYRYLFILTDEAMRLMRAREARSARPMAGGGGGSVAWRARVSGNMIGQLFLRSYERSDRVYNAMLARGYSGQFLTISPHQMHTKDWAIGATAIIIMLLLQVIGRLTLQ